MPRTVRPAVGLALLVALLGCRDDGRAPEIAPPDTVADVQPLTPAEIERRAEPMTPSEAEERGVVDTTIQVGAEP